jgi:polyferredoxin
MSRRRRLWTAARTRRTVQIALLVVFFGLVLAVRLQPGSDQPSPLAKLFLAIDPLVLAATALAAHTVPKILLWSLVVVGLTVVLGRVFCGWVCPMGTIHDVAGRLLRAGRAKRFQPWSRWQLTKYYLLAAFLAGAVFGLHWVVVLDPIVWLTRSTATGLVPAARWAAEESSTAVFQADPKISSWHLSDATDPAYQFLRDNVFQAPGQDILNRQAFVGGGLILGLLAVVVALNVRRPRFWCRYLCPLGALLGIVAWRPLVRRKTDQSTCTRCDLCGMTCHGAAASAGGEGWNPSECLGCMNCTDACPRGSLAFCVPAPGRRQPSEAPLDLRKRVLLGSAVGGVVALAAMRINPQSRGKVYHPALIRPPGSRDEREFLQRCLACGLCMKVCPTGGLHPTFTEAGLEGLWTPRLVPQIGYCDYNCTLCGAVCPTEAIVPLTLDQKRAIRIGLASFDVTRCIPYAYGRECMVCEEHCPIPDKAIYCVEVEVVDRSGQKRSVKQPHVDPEKCVGCGICEHVCPYEDRPGIRVTSANESRHAADPVRRPLGNQPILPASGDEPYG